LARPARSWCGPARRSSFRRRSPARSTPDWDFLALIAIPVAGVTDLVQQPVVPLSLFVALAIATAYELRERMSYVSAS